MELAFKKENKTWYIDLPSWEGSKEELSMVAGADTFLDMLNMLSGGKNIVNIKISTDPVEVFHCILKLTLDSGTDGADYVIDKFQDWIINHKLWLCPVTLFIFKGTYPKEIYVELLA